MTTIHDDRWTVAARRLEEGRTVALLPPVIPITEALNGVIRSVYDGDTLYVDVHLTGHTYVENQSIRLLGCNAAELKTPGGDAAAANLQALLPAGTPVVLSQIGSDKYAPRWDCAVAFLLNGVPTDLVSMLVAQGWAAAWNGQGKKPVPAYPRTVGATRTPAEYVARARRQMLDAGENPDQPVFACEAGRPTHGGGGE